MTTGLAIIFFGWANALYVIIRLFKGQAAGEEFMENTIEKFGPVVENTLDSIFNYGIS